MGLELDGRLGGRAPAVTLHVVVVVEDQRCGSWRVELATAADAPRARAPRSSRGAALRRRVVAAHRIHGTNSRGRGLTDHAGVPILVLFRKTREDPDELPPPHHEREPAPDRGGGVRRAGGQRGRSVVRGAAGDVGGSRGTLITHSRPTSAPGAWSGDSSSTFDPPSLLSHQPQEPAALLPGRSPSEAFHRVGSMTEVMLPKAARRSPRCQARPSRSRSPSN